jgi:hypothetical protein
VRRFGAIGSVIADCGRYQDGEKAAHLMVGVMLNKPGRWRF